jgi:REP element-mobilizing transposase RayT
MHVVARCNNREFCFAAPEDFEILLDHLGEMSRAYEIRLFGYSLMSNHFTSSCKLLLRMYWAVRFGGS